MFRTIHPCLAALAAVLALTAQSVHAAILMTVDANDQSAVTFTSTGLASSVSNSNSGYGVLLHGAMASDGNTSLQTPAQPDPFRWASGSNSGNTYVNYGDQGDALRLIVGGAQTQTFVTNETAFIGTTTVDLSFLNFVTTNLVGDIEIRDNFGQATGIIIGQYEFLVPEPTSLALLGLGSVALLRRRGSGSTHP